MKKLKYSFYNDFEWVGPEVIRLNGDYILEIDEFLNENKDLTESELYRKYLSQAKKEYAEKIWSQYLSEYTDFI